MSTPLPTVVSSLCKGGLALMLDPTGLTAVSSAGVDALFASLPDKTLKQKTKELEAKAFAHATRLLGGDARVSEYALATARQIVGTKFKGAADLTAHGENPKRTTEAVLERNKELLRHATDEENRPIPYLVESFIAAYAELPEVETALAGLSRKRIEKLLTRALADAEALHKSTQEIQNLLSLWVRTDVLYDPRWSPDKLFLDPGSQPSSQWLEARFEIVPLRNRRPQLDALREFRETDDSVNLVVVAGTGGAGKTRLLMEAVTEARRDGWHAGFVRSLTDGDALRAGLNAYDATDQPLFLVIDYAEDRPEQVAAVVAWALNEAVNRVRVVLLSRHEALVKQAVERLGSRDDTVREVSYYLDGDRVLRMGGGLGIPLEERAAFVAAAQATFAPLMAHPPTVDAATLDASVFDADHFGISIYLLAAALASFDGPILTGKLDLAEFMLAREWAYLSTVFKRTPYLEKDVLRKEGEECRNLLSVATLAMAARPSQKNLPSFDALLAATRLGTRFAGTETAEALRETLTGLYALPDAPDPNRHLDALRPDPLGEGLVFTTLPASPALVAWALAPERDDATVASACTVLVRTALAFEGEEADAWLRAVLPEEALATPRVVDALEGTIHQQTVSFAGLATTLAERQVERRRAEDNETDEAQSRLASALNTLGVRLSNAGRREEALVATEEAVEIRRALAERAPDAFRPDLAMSLNNLALDLADAGRREEALIAAEEAVAVYRALAERAPDAYRPYLSRSLWSLGFVHETTGHLVEATPSLAEALHLLRPFLLREHAAFIGQYRATWALYVRSCEAGGQAPDANLSPPAGA